MSPQYIEALRLNQIAFLDSITESPETTARYEAAEQAYLNSFKKKREKIGLNLAQYSGVVVPGDAPA